MIVRAFVTLVVAEACFLLCACAVAASPSWPSSYDSGPAGKNIILPPRKGVLVGIFADNHLINKRQHQVGRRLDIQHRFYTDCGFPTADVRSIRRHGRIPMISWAGPETFSLQEIANGEADACFRSFGAGLARWDHRLFLRIYWEFNGDWFPWSGTGSLFISAWRRTVNVLRNQGVRKASFVWAPDTSQPFAGSYPGNRYVDWVAADGYNWNSPNAWCTSRPGFSHPGWCNFREIFHGKKNVERVFGDQKPYMVAETGSREGAPGRKGRWFKKARDAIKAGFPHMHAFVYLDANLTPDDGCCNWSLDSSRSALRGFKALARDRHFWTRRH